MERRQVSEVGARLAVADMGKLTLTVGTERVELPRSAWGTVVKLSGSTLLQRNGSKVTVWRDGRPTSSDLYMPSLQDPDLEGMPFGLKGMAAKDRVPMRGHQPLKLPSDTVPGELKDYRLVTCSRATKYAASLPVTVQGKKLVRPFLWAAPEAKPVALPVPRPYTSAFVTSMNSRGDVCGMLRAEGIDPSAVVWSNGKATFIPLIKYIKPDRDYPRGPKHRLVFMAPSLITEDGWVFGSLGENGAGGQELWAFDGKEVRWLEDLILGGGFQFASSSDAALGSNGKDLLLKLRASPGSDRPSGWYRLS